jgi:hypothetical protein
VYGCGCYRAPLPPGICGRGSCVYAGTSDAGVPISSAQRDAWIWFESRFGPNGAGVRDGTKHVNGEPGVPGLKWPAWFLRIRKQEAAAERSAGKAPPNAVPTAIRSEIERGIYAFRPCIQNTRFIPSRIVFGIVTKRVQVANSVSNKTDQRAGCRLRTRIFPCYRQHRTRAIVAKCNIVS